MTCIHDGILRSHLDGELAGAELAEIGQHLVSCTDCRTRFDVSEITALRDLDGLRRLGLVVRTGKARATRAIMARCRSAAASACRRTPRWPARPRGFR